MTWRSANSRILIATLGVAKGLKFNNNFEEIFYEVTILYEEILYRDDIESISLVGKYISSLIN